MQHLQLFQRGNWFCITVISMFPHRPRAGILSNKSCGSWYEATNFLISYCYEFLMVFLKCTPKVRLVKLDKIVYFNHNQLYFNYFCPQSSSRENIGDSNYYSSVLILNAEWLPKTIAMLQGLSELLWLSFVSTCWQILYHYSVYLYVEGFFLGYFARDTRTSMALSVFNPLDQKSWIY